MLKRHVFFGVFVLGSCCSAFGGQLNVVNGSFEDPQPDRNWHYENPDGPYFSGSVPGWTDAAGATGIWRPTLIPTRPTFNAIPDGLQVGFASSGGEGSMMYQDLNHPFTAGETYRLSVFIGNRLDLMPVYNIGGTGYVALAADDGTVVANSGPVTANLGTFELVTLEFTATNADAFLGKNLRIELGNVLGNQASFDDVKVETVPEPTTMAALGLAGLAGLKRRRK